ncbi:MAG: fibro-slime domain-containing protein [Chitinispirillaceae bacterium]|nr:fibro-slime domain-containing protein [Chitinispirillaceae bacterium]
MDPVFRFQKVFFAALFVAVMHLIPRAELTIHVLHPWASDSARLAFGLYVQYNPYWYPGVPMSREAGDWFTYTFNEVDSSTNDRFNLVSYETTKYVQYDSSAKYPDGSQQMNFKEILTEHSNASELWIYVDDLKKPPRIVSVPPPGKVVRFFSPWDLGAPRVVLKGTENISIKMRGVPNLCGWFSYVHLDTTTTPILYFFNTSDSIGYGAMGLNDTTYIDFSGLFDKTDTLWLLPMPYPEGPPVLSETFPGRVADCPPITLAAKVWDIGNHIDFGGTVTNFVPGIVKTKLGSNGKPVHDPSDSTVKALSEWFTTEKFTGGYTNERCCNIVLHKNDDGLHEYQTSSFFPIDDFKHLDDAGSVANPNWADGNQGYEHNFHFVMELGCEFEYRKGQTFYFRGDDDVWVFIDSQLVVDIGGIHGPIERSVDLDTLGLTQGKSYSFKLFFAERHCCGSNFKMVTSINLRTSSNLFYTKSDYPAGGVQYDLYEKVTQGSLSCDVSGEVIDTVKAIVNFYIKGPSFDTAQKLDAGTHWNGVTISPDYSQIIISEENISGLEPGVYTITYYSSKNPDQSNKLIFIVTQSQKPVQIINSVISAALFADNGYGRADRAEIYFKDTLKKLPDSIIIAWPSLTDRKVFTGSSIISYNEDKNRLTVKATETFRPEATTYGGTDNLGVCYALDTSFSNPLSIISFRIADSIGPLIASASFSERTVAGPDTFILQFSENIIDTTCLGKSLLLIKPALLCTLTVIDIISIGSSFRVFTKALDGVTIAEGDSLRLCSDSPVQDCYGNHPHPENRPVALTIRKKPPEINKAFYRDVNSDGILDEVTVFFDKDITIHSVKGIISFRSLTSLSISESRIAHASARSVLTFDIRDIFQESVDGFTSGTMIIAVTLSDFPDYTATHSVSDSAAPVILDAYFSENAQSASRDISPDTLVVIFSEEITENYTDQPFTFKSPQGVYNPYTLFVKGSGHNDVKYYFEVYNIEGDGYPQENDSVFITPSGKVSDKYGNVQTDYNNRRALLKTRPVSLNLNVISGPSPFNPAKERFIITADPETQTKSAVKIRT